MNTYVALLRGINVGGKNKLPMAELRALLEELGLEHVKTYIQSGNVIFQTERTDAAALAEEISAAIGQSHSFTPSVIVLDKGAFQSAMEANPFPEAEDEPKSVHLFFLSGPPAAPGFETLDELKKENERYELIGNVFYLHAPDGIGRSKLAERFSRPWDVTITGRNWRTVGKIMEMVQSLESADA